MILGVQRNWLGLGNRSTGGTGLQKVLLSSTGKPEEHETSKQREWAAAAPYAPREVLLSPVCLYEPHLDVTLDRM